VATGNLTSNLALFRHDNVVVIFVAMDAGRDGMVRVFEDSLDDFYALLN
jgi:hypothetical protein